LFPANVTGQPLDNRIDCGPLKTKNTWEIVVTGTIPLFPNSTKIVKMSTDLTLISGGNLGAPYFTTDIKDIYLIMIPGETKYIYRLPKIADPDNDNVQIILDFGFAIIFSECWQSQRLLLLTPNNKTDLGIHPVAIILQDKNKWMRSRSYSFKIIIDQQKIEDDQQAKALALKNKKGGKVKLSLKKEKIRPNGELIIKIKGGSCPPGLIAQINN
jgi:hypothetical protein